MSGSRPRVAVTPPPFCKSPVLRAELSRLFPDSVFNDKGRYLSEPEMIEFLAGADAVVVGRDPVTDRVLGALPELKLVAKYGVGLDNVDRDALERRRVTLGWTAGVNKLSVAEMTLCFLIGLIHNIFLCGLALKQDRWLKDGGRQLTGKTVGVVGCGNVGKEVIRLLQPFQCRVLARDIIDVSGFCREAGASVAEFDDLVSQSDIVSLHVPLTELTRNMIDARVLGRMRESAFLINTSRGETVDPGALKTALRENRIAGAALDVFALEPPDDQELLACPNLFATPHIGGNAMEAVEAMGRSAIGHLAKFFGKA
ncbi:MAG: phosphoglycerate dehydrogenase [Nitrospinae bacterium]|nr:phosphoglycerate dehydrogenase [Nitrospinota bacterium]